MKKIIKIWVSCFLVLIVVFGIMPLTVSAASVSSESALRTNVKKGGTVKLTKDVALSSRLVIPAGKTVTLDLNGKTLSRSLTECAEDGSVILVEEGAVLIVSDTTNTDNGAIRGGAAVKGGGILNYGSLTLKSGRIVQNRAASKVTEEDGTLTVENGENGEIENFGGGIFNAAGAELTLCGGEITDNLAAMGGGVYSEVGAILTVETGSYTKVENGIKKTFPSEVTVRANRAVSGCGIYSASDIRYSGSPVICGNQRDEDIRLAKNCKLICGAIKAEKPSGITVCAGEPDVSAAGTSPVSAVFTEGFGTNNAGKVEQYFFSPDKSVQLVMTAAKDGEIKSTRGGTKTTVEVYEKGVLTKIEEFDSPEEAWTKAASYAKPCWYYFNNSLLRREAKTSNEGLARNTPNPNADVYYTDRYFPSWYSQIQVQGRKNDKGGFNKPSDYNGVSYDHWNGYLQDDHQVKITLGSDWKLNSSLEVLRFRNMILDLNGHCIDRGGKKQKNGNIISFQEFAKLTVIDGNPDSEGYNGFKGGVIANGNGDNVGGGFVLNDYAELNILGGTVYNCITDEHGGAVYANKDRAVITLKNCTFDSCKTKNSGDDCNGGALYIRHTMRTTVENVTFQNCYSEDNGGAVYLANRPGTVKLNGVTFKDNDAKDNGGAIAIGDIDGDKMFLLEAADCRFTGNTAGKDGGAVIVGDNDDSARHYAMVFRRCTFSDNTARDGSALELDDNSAALISCTVTGNTAKRLGAVYVNDTRSVSVGGMTVIKENTGQNLILEKKDDKTRVYPVGLKAGAEIVLSTNSTDTSTLVMRDIDQRQLTYFTLESGEKLEFTKNGEKTANLVTASVFGDGSVWAVAVIAGTAALAAAFILIKRKNNGRRADKHA